MKTFIASDFHGEDPCELVRNLYRAEEIESAVFLGDYDEPKILENILNLEIDKVVLVGNHDYAHTYDKVITSRYLKRPWRDYYDLWKDRLAGDFVRENAGIVSDLQVGYKRIGEIDGLRVAYVHGSLVSSYEEEANVLWGRLWDSVNSGFSHERRVVCNFERMAKEDYWTMFRGHDHKARIFYEVETGNDHLPIKLEEISGSGILRKGGRNIVSVGAYVEGEYILFDDENMKVEFLKV